MGLLRSLKDLVSDWRKTKTSADDMATKLPRIIGVEMVIVIKENFDLGGYDTGRGFTPWTPRKKATNTRYDKRKGVKGSVFNSANKILQQTSALQNAVREEVNGSKVKIGVDTKLVPYGGIHNEGLAGKAWGKVPFIMPKRQYMPIGNEGMNPKMEVRVKKKLDYEVDKAMKLFKK